MRSADWIKLDPKNLPEPQRMLVCNGAGEWAVDGVHQGRKDSPERGDVFAFVDFGKTLACDLSHYAPIERPLK